MNTPTTLQHTSFQHKVLKYFEVAKINYHNNATYGMKVIARSGMVIIRIWIFAQLYRASYSVSGATEIEGLTVRMVIWSLMFAQGFQIATKPVISKLIEEEVKTGTIAHTMNKPYSYILFHYFGFLGRTSLNLLANIAMGIIAVLLLVGPIHLAPIAVFSGILLLFLGYTLDFLIMFIIGISAFWIEDSSAFTWIYGKGQLVFGGLVIPLALFPESIRGIAELLPFSQLYYNAARIAVNFDTGLFLKFGATQLAWILIAGALSLYLFKKGVKNVSLNGG